LKNFPGKILVCEVRFEYWENFEWKKYKLENRFGIEEIFLGKFIFYLDFLIFR
jgi:hypothetical protein